MKRFFVLFVIFLVHIWSENVNTFKCYRSKKKKNGHHIKRHITNDEEKKNEYSFLMLGKENEEENKDNKENNQNVNKDNNDNNNSEKKNEEQNHNNEKKQEESTNNNNNNVENNKKEEENHNNEKKTEEQNNNNEKKQEEENHKQKKNDMLPPEKKINKENLLEYGTHDKEGHFIPSYKTLTDEILSTNNAMEKASSFLKIACSHVMKLIEFIPESKLSSQYIKVDNKNIYLKDIAVECQNNYFNLEKFSMTLIVFNSKINKFIYSQEK
ncbi:conserved Plasmodium protein, unknown function [Plasmodium sp. gorilla clade G2]|uniref:conserved Plasmodium protein, unknown function n=1 Tax=Plasmodium sp. gorilla clade G2 TaxID=880535 RepID=UPI000D220F4E|nr:conserved Plasmodium protein, unknown function [Plasmodium sp. gorilla clade G2]SOV14752.1 conserved Plasmodium protein, unknown function [Plasmodium sp. gorilla clade G2]